MVIINRKQMDFFDYILKKTNLCIEKNQTNQLLESNDIVKHSFVYYILVLFGNLGRLN